MASTTQEPSAASALLTEAQHPCALPTRVAQKVREVGLRYTLILGLRVLVPAAVFRFARLAILEILPDEGTEADEAEEHVHWAEPEDAQRLAGFGHPRDVVQRRLGSAACAFIVSEADALLAYAWFRGPDHDEEDLGVRFSLTSGEIWLFDAMVKRDQRGRGLYPRFLRHATHDLRRMGVRRILIAVETANRNAMRAHRAAGAASIGMVVGLRVLGFTFVRCGRNFRAAWTGTKGYVRLVTSDIA